MNKHEYSIDNFTEVFMNISGIKSIRQADFIAICDQDSDLCYILRKNGVTIEKSLIITRDLLFEWLREAVNPIIVMNTFIDYFLEIKEKMRSLECKLDAVMHSVDKWFDEVDESKDEVNRAADAREIALNAINDRDILMLKIMKKVDIILKKHCTDIHNHNKYPSTTSICMEINNLFNEFYNTNKEK